MADNKIDSTSRRATAPALRRGLAILEQFLDNPAGLRVPELSERLGLPRASVHELVSALVDCGYLVEADGEPNAFRLGVKVLQLGSAYAQDLDLATCGRRVASSVAAQCEETVQLAIRDGVLAVYVVRIDSVHAVRLVSSVGSRLAAHCTAGGKMLLAALDREEIDRLFPDDGAVVPMTDRSINNRERLFAELAKIREQGWSEEHCESNPDAACVAAPVYDASGECVAALSVTTPTVRWTEQSKRRQLELVGRGAAELSHILGATVE